MAMGKFQGVIRPTTPTGSRVISTSTPGARRQLLAGQAQAFAGEELEDLAGARDLADALGQGLALLAGQQAAELVLAGDDLVADALEDVVALLDRRARPGREGVMRRRDRALGIGGRGAGELAHHVVGVRRIDVRRGLRRRDPFAGDEVLASIVNLSDLVLMRPRWARLVMSARMPKVQGSHSELGFMRLTSAPSLGAAMVTMSPGLWVKPMPGSSRSCVGANMVPRKSTKPSGYWWCGPMVCATRSSGSRLILAIDDEPSSRKPSSPFHRQRHRGPAHVVEREGVVEEPDEGPDGAGRIVVLGLREQQRRAAFEIAQVHVVAERRADDPSLQR